MNNNKLNFVVIAMLLGVMSNAYASNDYAKEIYDLKVDGVKGNAIEAIVLSNAGLKFIPANVVHTIYPNFTSFSLPKTSIDGVEYYSLSDVGSLDVDDATLVASLVLNNSFMPNQKFSMLRDRYLNDLSVKGSGFKTNYSLNYDVGAKDFYSTLTPVYYKDGDLYYSNFSVSEKNGFDLLDLNYRTRINDTQFLQLGTNTSSGSTINSGNRFVGIHFSKNWDTEKTDISKDYLAFNGTSEVAGTAELFLNGERILQTEIQRGNYIFDGIQNNYSSGGTVDLVVRDYAGRVTTTTQSIVGKPMNLKEGFFDYSLNAGFLRPDNNKLGDFFASGNVAYGLTKNLTVGAFIEASSERQNLSASATYSTRLGAFTGAYSVGDGSAYKLGYQYSNKNFYVNADYTNLSNQRGIGSNSAKNYDQISLTGAIKVFKDKYLNLRYFKIGDEYSAGVGSSFMLNKNVSMNVSINKNSNKKPYVYVGLNIFFDRMASYSASYNGDNGTYSNRISGSNIKNTFDYYLENVSGGGVKSNNIRAAYKTETGEIRSNLYQRQGGDINGYINLSGSVVGYKDNLYLTKSLNGSYAIIDAQAKDIPINSSAGYRGKTNKDGILIFPVAPFSENSIYLNANDFPTDVSLKNERISFNAYPDAPVEIKVPLLSAGFLLNIPNQEIVQSIKIFNKDYYNYGDSYYIDDLPKGIHEFELNGTKYSFDASNLTANQKIIANVIDK